jgi:predicted PhzF superfamily epimerase YddE/YHI9
VPTLHVLRVFVNEDGEWGNPLGVFLDGEKVPERARQGIAAELGFSETVFVDNRTTGRIRIHTPTVELPFAGHPSVGVAWLLAREGTPVDMLKPPAGTVGVRLEDGVAFVAARPEWAPRFRFVQFDSPTEVRALPDAPDGEGNTYAWAWIDDDAGTIRARSFVPEAGIAEDEATGSAALALSAQLGRPVTIHQGRGSVLICRPVVEGLVEVGGNTTLSEVREYALPGGGG